MASRGLLLVAQIPCHCLDQCPSEHSGHLGAPEQACTFTFLHKWDPLPNFSTAFFSYECIIGLLLNTYRMT